jgi:hypothetical protein
MLHLLWQSVVAAAGMPVLMMPEQLLALKSQAATDNQIPA